MNPTFLQSLGGIVHFLEVEKDPASRPRDKLLARRTWWHRELLSYTEFTIKNPTGTGSIIVDALKIDHLIVDLNNLRITQSLNFNLIESKYIEIRKQFE